MSTSIMVPYSHGCHVIASLSLFRFWGREFNGRSPVWVHLIKCSWRAQRGAVCTQRILRTRWHRNQPNPEHGQTAPRGQVEEMKPTDQRRPQKSSPPTRNPSTKPKERKGDPPMEHIPVQNQDSYAALQRAHRTAQGFKATVFTQLQPNTPNGSFPSTGQ